MKMKYKSCCVQSDGKAITKMVEAAQEIKFSTFRRKCEVTAITPQLGYASTQKRGLTLKNDWHVRYYSSDFEGVKCVFMDHSAIEYIFT